MSKQFCCKLFRPIVSLKTNDWFCNWVQYGHYFSDPEYDNVQRIICCDQFATYAIDFEFNAASGFTRWEFFLILCNSGQFILRCLVNLCMWLPGTWNLRQFCKWPFNILFLYLEMRTPSIHTRTGILPIAQSRLTGAGHLSIPRGKIYYLHEHILVFVDDVNVSFHGI